MGVFLCLCSALASAGCNLPLKSSSLSNFCWYRFTSSCILSEHSFCGGGIRCANIPRTACAISSTMLSSFLHRGGKDMRFKPVYLGEFEQLVLLALLRLGPNAYGMR